MGNRGKGKNEMKTKQRSIKKHIKSPTSGKYITFGEEFNKNSSKKGEKNGK